MIVFPDTGELVSYDFDHARGTETCIVLNIETGEDKARAAVNSPVQCLVFPAIGWQRDVYITTFATIARAYIE